MMKITTDLALKKIKLPSAGRTEYRDSRIPGLFLRVSPTGKIWYLSVRPPGEKHPRRIKIGPYGTGTEAYTLKEAHIKAMAWKDAIKAGDDPRDEAKARVQRFQNNFSGITDRFLEQYVKRNLKPNTYSQYRGILKGDDLAGWRSKPIHKIQRKDVLAKLDDIAESGRFIQANRTLAILRRFFNWCAEKDIIKSSEVLPTDRVKPPLKKEKPRSRYLLQEEIKLIWDALDAFGYPFGAYIKLLMATGQRRSEVQLIRFSDIDFEKKTWTQKDNKGGRPHIVPLSDFALTIIDSIENVYGSEYLFTLGGMSPMSVNSKDKKRLDTAINKLLEERELTCFFKEPWQLHDIRRTMTTHLRKLGFPQDVCGKLLNHAQKGVTAEHYDMYDMLKEKTHAMETWGRFLEGIIDGKQDNIIDFNRA
ncbi:MAG: tyrosine-type recombinase/integrase [Porticoccus sp.]